MEIEFSPVRNYIHILKKSQQHFLVQFRSELDIVEIDCGVYISLLSLLFLRHQDKNYTL